MTTGSQGICLYETAQCFIGQCPLSPKTITRAASLPLTNRRVSACSTFCSPISTYIKASDDPWILPPRPSLLHINIILTQNTPRITVTIQSGIDWFEDISWIGKQIEFHKPQMRWKITGKVLEKECFRSDEEVEDFEVFNQAHAVFMCLNSHDPGQKGVLKVLLQIPKWETWSESAETRAQQAAPLYTKDMRHEIEALQLLTKANCSSAPKSIASQSEKQGETDWVPGGYMDLILMERVPGFHPSSRGDTLRSYMLREERDEIRAAFKEAWL
ncbi:unnamed protein product [Penicillium glandicola]